MSLFNSILTSRLVSVLATRPHIDYGTLRPGKRSVHTDLWRAYVAKLGYPQPWVDPQDPMMYIEDDARIARVIQQDLGLVADGIVGAKTWQALIAEPAALAPDVGVKPWQSRVNTLLRPGVWNKCGYYSNTSKDSQLDKYRIGLAKSTQRAAAKALGNTATNGMSCGHLVNYFIALAMGHPEPRWCATGMNLAAFKRAQDRKPPANSTCGVALFRDGKAVDCGDWTAVVRGFADRVIPWKMDALKGAPGCGPIEIWEFPSHVILRVWADGGLLDPRTNRYAVPQWYRIAADGGKLTPGKPWTFRRWRESDELDGNGRRPVNVWCVDPATGEWQSASLEV